METAAHRLEEDADRRRDVVGEYRAFLSWPSLPRGFFRKVQFVIPGQDQETPRFYSLVYILNYVRFRFWICLVELERMSECGSASSRFRKIPYNPFWFS